MLVKILNYAGLGLIILSFILMVNDVPITLSTAVAILGMVLTVPDTLIFHKGIRRKNDRLSGYWSVKLAGYFFVLILLMIIFITTWGK